MFRKTQRWSREKKYDGDWRKGMDVWPVVGETQLALHSRGFLVRQRKAWVLMSHIGRLL